MIPENLQICEKLQIGFCGDWFDFEGFGRIQEQFQVHWVCHQNYNFYLNKFTINQIYFLN